MAHTIHKFLNGLTLISLIIIALFAVLMFRDLYHFRKNGTYTVDLPSITGYASKYSFDPDEQIDLFIHADKPAKAKLYRLGEELVPFDVAFEVEPQPQSPQFSRYKGMGWNKTHQLSASDFPAGVYVLEITTGEDEADAESFRIPFVVKPEAPPKIALVLSTHTWDAYNAFGGASNYSNQQFSAPVNAVAKVFKKLFGEPHLLQDHLPYARPNQLISEDLAGLTDPYGVYNSRFIRNEWSMIAFLEKHGYDFAVYVDEDMEPNGAAYSSDVLLLAGHMEYWTGGMIYGFDRYVARGGKVLASAAGKPLAEPVQLRAHGKGFPSEHFPASWTASRLGAAFTLMDMFSAAPFEVVEPDHWVFSGASLQEGDIFGEESLFVPEAWIDFWARYNYPTGGQGASGLYMSKVTAGSEDFQILAQGLNAEGGAHMVYRDTPAGGWIFSSSSETFNGALS